MSIVDPKLLEIQKKMERGESFLKAFREAMGYTRKQLADALLTTETTIYRWESGKSPATLTVAQAKAFSSELKKLSLTIENVPDDLGPSPKQT